MYRVVHLLLLDQNVEELTGADLWLVSPIEFDIKMLGAANMHELGIYKKNVDN